MEVKPLKSIHLRLDGRLDLLDGGGGVLALPQSITEEQLDDQVQIRTRGNLGCTPAHLGMAALETLGLIGVITVASIPI